MGNARIQELGGRTLGEAPRCLDFRGESSIRRWLAQDPNLRGIGKVMEMKDQLGMSIGIFLADRTPEGLRIVEESNWSGVGHASDALGIDYQHVAPAAAV